MTTNKKLTTTKINAPQPETDSKMTLNLKKNNNFEMNKIFFFVKYFNTRIYLGFKYSNNEEKRKCCSDLKFVRKKNLTQNGKGNRLETKCY